MRIKIMAANWKMHKTLGEVPAFFTRLRQLAPRPECQVVVAPPYPLLAAAAAAAGDAIAIAAQDLYWETEGAFTGEVSGAMLVSVGCRHVIIGHSERRRYFGETDAAVNRKIRAALACGLSPIVCVGETEPERLDGKTEAVLRRQFEGAFEGLDAVDLHSCILAYEPVWAIGTGKVATPAQAGAAHQFLRHCAAQFFTPHAAEHLAILYGGSLAPANAKPMLDQPDVDGGLIGSASLDPDAFAELIAAAAQAPRMLI